MDRSLAMLIAVVLAGCVSAPPVSLPVPTEAERVAAKRAGYEVGPVRRARELLPAHVIEGPHHRVHDEVANDGSANLYAIASDFGPFEAHGDAQLYVRIREIEALAAMQSMSGTSEFAKAAGLALTSPFVATWNLITNPVDSIRGVPVGAWETVRKAALLAQHQRSEFEDSGLSAFIGFEAKKRLIAAKLGVDPYSSNQQLQRRLNRFAWAAYAGSLPSMFVPFTAGEEATPEREERIDNILLEYSPEDLRRLNRIELAVMGISRALADSFVDHRWYSPRHETVLVDTLAGLDLVENRAAFIEAAVTAQSEDEALSFLITARLLRDYNDAVSPIRQIVAVEHALMGHTEQRSLVLPLPADHAVWTPTTAALCHSAGKSLPVPLEIENTALVVSGSVSELTRDRVQALGIDITEHALRWFPDPNSAELE